MAGELARDILLPPVIRANLEREEMVERQLSKGSALFGALKALDPRLDLVFVYPNAPARYDVIPGRWHVVRRNDPPAPDTYYPIVTESGGYREPDSGVLTEMQSRDLHRALPAPPKPPDDSLVKEQIKDEFMADFRAAKRVAGDNVHKRRWGRK